MNRYYVTLTWDDWPEGGSYGTIVEADNQIDAEAMVRAEMRTVACLDRELSITEDADYLRELDMNWHLVDCWDLDEFIMVTHA